MPRNLRVTSEKSCKKYWLSVNLFAKEKPTRLIDTSRRCRDETVRIKINEFSYHLRFLVSMRTVRTSIGNFPKSSSPETRHHAGLSRQDAARSRRRGPFLRRVGADEYPALRGKPQIETAIWRYLTWIDESTDACSVSACLKENIYGSLEMTAPDESSGAKVPTERIFIQMYHQK